VLALYEGCVGLYVAHERAKLLHIVQQLERTNHRHEQLIRVNDGLAHSIVDLQQALNSDRSARLPDPVRADLATVSQGLSAFVEPYPELLRPAQHFGELVAELGEEPQPDALVALRDAEQQLALQVASAELQAQQNEHLLRLHYVDLNHRITIFLLFVNGLGLACFGAAVTLFFSKLASDISQLEAHAMAVVGEDGTKLRELSRGDEVGGLMRAINRMQAELQRREQSQEISRQQLLHQEKMAAIGSMAATLAHEIGNPINSISGMAQHTIDAFRCGRHPDSRTLLENAELTVQQSERIGAIVRQLADLSAPRRQEPELLNLNEVIKSTCGFLRYDKRFRGTELVTDLDRSLPAVRGVADHLTQVLMNLLINSADALEGKSQDKPTIRVATGQAQGEITLSVQDNGHGMDPSVLALAFRQRFTTKPAGKGRGIGLYLCKKLVEDSGGRIELQSAPGAGTIARVRLPCARMAAAA